MACASRRSIARPGPSTRSIGERHVELIRSTIRLAGELGVRKIVTMSGNPGDGAGSTAVNFTWYPWPDDSMALLDRQWAAAIELWQDLGAYAARPRRRAAGVRAAPAASRLQRAHAAADARCGRADHRRQPRPVAPLLAADGPARGHRGAGAGRLPRPPQGHGAAAGAGRAGRRPRPASVRRIRPTGRGSSGRSGSVHGPSTGRRSSPPSARRLRRCAVDRERGRQRDARRRASSWRPRFMRPLLADRRGRT